MCDKNQAIYNTWLVYWNIRCKWLKVFKTFDVWLKKLNHIFNDDKYYYFFLIYTKQPLSGYTTLRKTLHIKKVNKAF